MFVFLEIAQVATAAALAQGVFITALTEEKIYVHANLYCQFEVKKKKEDDWECLITVIQMPDATAAMHLAWFLLERGGEGAGDVDLINRE